MINLVIKKINNYLFWTELSVCFTIMSFTDSYSENTWIKGLFRRGLASPEWLMSSNRGDLVRKIVDGGIRADKGEEDVDDDESSIDESNSAVSSSVSQYSLRFSFSLSVDVVDWLM